MHKSRWAAAAGLGSLVLLLAACGGSSGTTSAPGTASQSNPASQSTSASASSSTPKTPATGTTSTKAAAASTPTPHHTAGPQPSSNVGSQPLPPQNATIMTVRLSNLGYVLAEAGGYVVYTYAKDHKGGSPTCTGSCATVWVPVTGVPLASPAVTIPGTFALVTRAGGVKQITYNGYPLYIYKPGGIFATTGNGIGGMWYVIKMSASDVHG